MTESAEGSTASTGEDDYQEVLNFTIDMIGNALSRRECSLAAVVSEYKGEKVAVLSLAEEMSGGVSVTPMAILITDKMIDHLIAPDGFVNILDREEMTDAKQDTEAGRVARRRIAG